MSLFGTDGCEKVAPPTAASFTTAAFAVILGLATTVGNSLVLLAIAVDPNKDLRRPFNCLLFNLALADLFVGLFMDPLSAISHVLEGVPGIQPASALLTTRNMTFFISCTASLLSLAALTVDRYIAIASPLKYRSTTSNLRAVIISVVIWSITVPFSFLYFAVGYNVYRFVFANTAVVTTFAVIVFTYVKIFRAFGAQMRLLDRMHESNVENHSKRLAMAREKKVTTTLMVVLLLFIACYFPSCVFVYIINLCVNCGCVFIHWIRDLQIVLVLLNSAVNPIVYAWRLKSFQRAFARFTICKMFEKKTQELRTTAFVVTSQRHEISVTVL